MTIFPWTWENKLWYYNTVPPIKNFSIFQRFATQIKMFFKVYCILRCVIPAVEGFFLPKLESKLAFLIQTIVVFSSVL